MIRRHDSDAVSAHCSRSPSQQSGRATNRAGMSCAGRLKQVFDLDIEQRSNCRGGSSGDTLPTSHDASSMGRYPGSGLDVTTDLLPILGWEESEPASILASKPEVKHVYSISLIQKHVPDSRS